MLDSDCVCACVCVCVCVCVCCVINYTHPNHVHVHNTSNHGNHEVRQSTTTKTHDTHQHIPTTPHTHHNRPHTHTITMTSVTLTHQTSCTRQPSRQVATLTLESGTQYVTRDITRTHAARWLLLHGWGYHGNLYLPLQHSHARVSHTDQLYRNIDHITQGGAQGEISPWRHQIRVRYPGLSVCQQSGFTLQWQFSY